MNNRYLVYMLLASLAGMVIGLALWAFGPPSDGYLLSASQSLFLLTGIYLLVKNGTFIRTRGFRWLGISIALVLVGAMFKLMHWKGADLMIGSGLASVGALYLVHFVKKPGKAIADAGKLAFLLTFLAGKYFRLMHWPMAGELSFLSVVIYFVHTKGMASETK
jgi:hypothetical protein